MIQRIFLLLFSFIFLFPAWGDDAADPNALLAFKTLVVESPQDNVQGTFRSIVEQAYGEVFAANPRFSIIANRKATDGILRTKIQKKTTEIDIELQLEVGPTNEVYLISKKTVPSDADGSTILTALRSALKNILQKIPFYGTVTGRDGKHVTLDIGSHHGIHVGDEIQIGRIDSIKRHPLLKQIIDVQLVPVGTVTITDIENSLAFGEIENEISGEQIKRFYKVTSVEAKHIEEGQAKKDDQHPDKAYGIPEAELENPDAKRPRYGFVGLGVELSTFDASSSREANSYTGNAFNPGVRLDGELWVTDNWFADLNLGASMMTYSQETGSSTIKAGVGASTLSIGVDGGYRFLFSQSIYGPQLYGKVGFYFHNWSIDTLSTDLVTSRSYNGINLGVGGLLPFGHSNVGALLQVNLLLFPSYSEDTTVIGTDSSSTVIRFLVGGYYFLNTRIALRAALDFQSYQSTISSVPNGSHGEKVVGFITSVQYYF